MNNKEERDIIIAVFLLTLNRIKLSVRIIIAIQEWQIKWLNMLKQGQYYVIIVVITAKLTAIHKTKLAAIKEEMKYI